MRQGSDLEFAIARGSWNCPVRDIVWGESRSDKRMNRERVPSQVDRRTKDMKPATLGLHLLTLRMARPDLPSSPGIGVSSDVRLRHVCGRKRAGISNVDKGCSAGSQAAGSRSPSFETPET